MAVQDVKSVNGLDCEIIDADFHLTEQISDFAPYLEAPWDSMLTGDDPFDEKAEFWDPFPDPGQISPHIASGRSQIFHPDKVRNLEDIKEGLNLLDADRGLITPGATVLKLGCVHNDDIAVAIASAFNEFMLNEFADQSNDIYVPITIAGQKPTKAAEEIDDRKNESAISCIFLPNGGLNPPLGHEWYDPIFEATEKANLPFVMHGGAGANTLKSFPIQYDWFTTSLEDHVIGHPFQHIVNMVSMVTHGIPEQFDIDFLFQEAGIGWIPFIANRMDNEYYQKRQDAPGLTKKPSEYIFNEFYYASQPLEGLEGNPEYVCQMARMMNAENNLMWASDYPHHDFERADSIFKVLAREFKEKELENIFGETAKNVFF